MKRSLVLVILASLLLSACGGAPKAPATPAPSGGGTGGGQPTSAAPTAAASATPDNTVATAVPGSSNFDFASALALGKEPVKASVKEQNLYYKLDVPKGGVVTGTLSVDAGSPGPAKLTLYNELQNYVSDVQAPVGQSAAVTHVFDDKTGGTVFFSVSGTSSFTLVGSATTQNDAGTGKDAGGDFGTAVQIKTGQFTGLLGDDDRYDYYSIDLPKTGVVVSVTVQSLTPDTGQVKAALYNDQKSYVADASATASDPAPAGFQRVLAGGQGGRWFLELQGTGAYRFSIQTTPQNDAGTGKDAGGDFASATPVKTGQSAGLLGDDDAYDYYSLELPKTGSVLSITFKSLSTANETVKMTLYNDQQSYVADVSSAGGDPAAAALERILADGEGGRWFLEFHGSGPYEFSIQTAPQNDAGTGKDASNEQGQALAAPSASFTGMLGNDDQEDAYKVTAALGHTIKLTWVSGAGNLKITVYGLDGSYVTDASVSGPGESVEVKDTGTGDYIIVVGARSDTAVQYSVDVSP